MGGGTVGGRTRRGITTGLKKRKRLKKKIKEKECSPCLGPLCVAQTSRD